MHKLSALQIEKCNAGAKEIFHAYMIVKNSNDARYGHLKNNLSTSFTKMHNDYLATEADAICLLCLNEKPIGKKKEQRGKQNRRNRNNK